MALVPLLSGCSTLSYYWQAAGGHLALMHARVPIAEILADPDTPESLRGKLEVALSARNWATAELGLPDNGSYTAFADVGRPYLLWNVVATPELSLEPVRWCLLVAGCVSYRGYFKEQRAERHAAELRSTGHDVIVAGVAAYSTLGWFADPVVNTMTGWPDHALAALIMHELAHQAVYVPGDSAFNEAFATAVAELGLAGWLAAEGRAEDRQAAALARARRIAFIELVSAAREELLALYASARSSDEKRREKAALFARLRDDYQALRATWDGYAGYDRWFAELNNAKLAAVATYHRQVPAFRAVYADAGSRWPEFLARVRAAAKLDDDDRQRWIARWLATAKNG